MKYLLDTNIVSYFLRGQFANLEQRILNTAFKLRTSSRPNLLNSDAP